MRFPIFALCSNGPRFFSALRHKPFRGPPPASGLHVSFFFFKSSTITIPASYLFPSKPPLRVCPGRSRRRNRPTFSPGVRVYARTPTFPRPPRRFWGLRAYSYVTNGDLFCSIPYVVPTYRVCPFHALHQGFWGFFWVFVWGWTFQDAASTLFQAQILSLFLSIARKRGATWTPRKSGPPSPPARAI